MYVQCRHGAPRNVFSDRETSSLQPEANSSVSSTRSRSINEEDNVPLIDMQSLNQHLLKGNTEGLLLSAFGVAQGWGILLRHCIFCFLGGCVCSFVHLGILVWMNEDTVLSSILMPVAFIGFIPPLMVYLFWMGPPDCVECKRERCVFKLLD